MEYGRGKRPDEPGRPIASEPEALAKEEGKIEITNLEKERKKD